MEIINLLKALKEESVSDVFLSEGKLPRVRRHGQVEKFAGGAVSKEDFISFLKSISLRELGRVCLWKGILIWG